MSVSAMIGLRGSSVAKIGSSMFYTYSGILFACAASKLFDQQEQTQNIFDDLRWLQVMLTSFGTWLIAHWQYKEELDFAALICALCSHGGFLYQEEFSIISICAVSLSCACAYIWMQVQMQSPNAINTFKSANIKIQSLLIVGFEIGTIYSAVVFNVLSVYNLDKNGSEQFKISNFF